MKNIKILFSTLVFSVFFVSSIFVGCTKENDTPKNKQTNYNMKTSVEPVMRTLYNNPLGVYCEPPALNCLPTVIIIAFPNKDASPLELAYADFIAKFENNNIQDFFKTGDYLTLFPQILILPNVLTELQNSDIILHYQKSEVDGYDYYIGLPKNVTFESDWKGMEKCVFVIHNEK